MNDPFELPSLEEIEEMERQIENYRRGNTNVKDDDVKLLKAELAELLEEDAKADKLRSLLCIAAELLAGNSCVQSAMIRSTYYKIISR